jgi:hypothetical protein
MYIGLHVNICYSCHILKKFEISWQIFVKSSNIKFHVNPSSGNRVAPCGRTTELTVFQNFVNVPKKLGGGGWPSPDSRMRRGVKRQTGWEWARSIHHQPLSIRFKKQCNINRNTCQLLSNNEASEKCCNIILQQLTPTEHIQFTASRVSLQVLKPVQRLTAPRGAWRQPCCDDYSYLGMGLQPEARQVILFGPRPHL